VVGGGFSNGVDVGCGGCGGGCGGGGEDIQVNFTFNYELYK
jgi:hypothetical protein